jgi:DNA-binding transcriptional LysR family regulator
MDSQVLRTFIAVARHGSFAAAARSVDTDPSLVSRAIAGLENELGVRLFQRTTRQMTLTEAGGLYLNRIEAVVAEIDHARDDALAVASCPRGTLRITASVAFGQTCLVPLIAEFRATFPEVNLELILSDDNMDLVASRIDLAIRLAPSIEGDVICTKLFDTRYRVCASPDYILKAPAIRKPQDLSAHDSVLFALPEFRSRWLFRRPDGKTAQVPVKG